MAIFRLVWLSPYTFVSQQTTKSKWLKSESELQYTWCDIIKLTWNHQKPRHLQPGAKFVGHTSHIDVRGEWVTALDFSMRYGKHGNLYISIILFKCKLIYHCMWARALIETWQVQISFTSLYNYILQPWCDVMMVKQGLFFHLVLPSSNSMNVRPVWGRSRPWHTT